MEELNESKAPEVLESRAAVEEYELQIRNISARITKIKEEIDVELGKTLTEKVIEKLHW